VTGHTLPDDSAGPSGAGERRRHESLVVVIDNERPTRMPAQHPLRGVDTVLVGRAAGDDAESERSGVELVVGIPDPRLSSAHFRLLRTAHGFDLADQGSRNGTLVNGRAHSAGPVFDGDVVEAGRTLFLARLEDDAALRDPVLALEGDSDLVSLAPAMQAILVALGQIAKSRVPVLVDGETGTGKELVARAVHRLSARPASFVPINCGAIPSNLVESELFGHKKGAFSGATEDRIGLVQSAHKGTLFLDEIGDLPLAAQAALLRVLQEREVVPVGATRPVPVDFRLVAATHRPLRAMVEAGTFRDDLYARVAGSTFRLPALRDRREDLGLLVRALLLRTMGDAAAGVRFAANATRALVQYDWPRNVRELGSVLESAIALREADRIELGHLPAAIAAAADLPTEGDAPDPADEQRRAEILALMKTHGGNVSAVARAMGKGRTQIHRWLRRYGIR